MANGNGIPRIPGFSLVGGVSVSNTAVLVGAGVIALGLWFMYTNNKKSMIPSESQALDTIEADVYAYAANPTEIQANRDRIRAAIERARSTYRAARDAYRKKLKDLRDARRAGTITNEQFRVQHRAAVMEFLTAIRQRWKEIHDALGIPTRNPHVERVEPTQA